MPQFPKKEEQILALTSAMVAGYMAHATDFPGVNITKLIMSRRRCITSIKTRNLAKAALQLTTEAKTVRLNALKDLMKSCLKQSVVDTVSNPKKLALIGWGPRALRQCMQPPGQPENLTVIEKGKDTLLLQWQKLQPAYPVRNYIIERRQLEANGTFGRWAVIATALNPQIKLTGQPSRTCLEYRVKAVNTNSQSTPSNTITVVL